MAPRIPLPNHYVRCLRPLSSFPPSPLTMQPQVPEFLGAGARQFAFMLKGLRELAPRLEAHGIPFFLLQVWAWSGAGSLVEGSQVWGCGGVDALRLEAHSVLSCLLQVDPGGARW